MAIAIFMLIFWPGFDRYDPQRQMIARRSHHSKVHHESLKKFY